MADEIKILQDIANDSDNETKEFLLDLLDEMLSLA